MPVEQMTLYNVKISPYGQRVELALVEAGAEVTKYYITSKPGWFTPNVNPAGQVPALTYDGPKVAPDDPSPKSAKIVESLIILEFLADIYPSAHLLPPDPVSRARARFFMQAMEAKVVAPFIGFMYLGNVSMEVFIDGLANVQAMLPIEGGFAAGKTWSIADAAIAPFLGRTEMLLRNRAGKPEEEVQKKTYEVLFESEKFGKLERYCKDLTSRESWKATFPEDEVVAYFKKLVGQNK